MFQSYDDTSLSDGVSPDQSSITDKWPLQALISRLTAAKAEGPELRMKRCETALFEAMRPLALHITHRYKHVSVSEEDVRQEAFVALLEAIRGFVPGETFNFGGFAAKVIERRLGRFIRAQSHTVRRPDSWYRRMAKIRAAETELEKCGSPVTDSAIAKRLDVPVELVCRWRSLGRSELSLQAPAGDGNSGDMGQVVDLIEDETSEPPGKKVAALEVVAQLRGALTTLSLRDRTVIEMRFGLSGDDSIEALSLMEIGEKLGVSRERVRQLEERGLRLLKERISGPA